jgi:uncharacterized C2H2 Zn-finger protein
LLCPLCVIDPTIKAKDKQTKYSLSKLNYHVTAGTHSREEQLKRAIKADNTFPIVCPNCGLPYKTSRDFIKHVKESHSEQLWEDFGDDEEEEEVEGDEDEDDDSTVPPGAADQPVAYTGKGKGKA